MLTRALIFEKRLAVCRPLTVFENARLRALAVVSSATDRNSRATWRPHCQRFEKLEVYSEQVGSFCYLFYVRSKLDPRGANLDYIGRSVNRTARCNGAEILAGQ